MELGLTTCRTVELGVGIAAYECACLYQYIGHAWCAGQTLTLDGFSTGLTDDFANMVLEDKASTRLSFVVSFVLLRLWCMVLICSSGT